jgi:outer membrane beta-barrel protein
VLGGNSALLAAAVVMIAATAAPAAAELPSEAPLPSCLDRTLKEELAESLQPRGVQAKTFLRRHKVSLLGRGGLFGGDLTSSSWIAGGALGFWLSEDVAIEASVEVTPIELDLDKPLAEFFGDDRFEPGLGTLAMAGVTWAPIHAKLRLGQKIVHSDILLTGGAGRLMHTSVQGVTLHAGAALELLTSRWLTVRLDVRDVMALQEAAAETRFTNNLVVTLGASVWIPTGL